VTGSPQLAVLALNKVAEVLGKLTEEQLTDLVNGRGVIEFRTPEVTITSRATRAPRTSAPKAPPAPALEVDEILQAVQALADEDAVERYLLDHDKQISLPTMTELARKIGPPVTAKGPKYKLRKSIAAGTGGLRNRPAAIFSGGWGN
jgi:hypothetical protein